MIAKLSGKSEKEIRFDPIDIVKILKHKWYFIPDSRSGHAYAKINGKTVYLHRLIMNPPKGKVVDHINRDGLDCHRSNMRIVTHRENLQNHNLLVNNTSGVTGVRWHKRDKQWYAEIGSGIGQKAQYLGMYKTFDEAYFARLEAEKVRGIIK